MKKNTLKYKSSLLYSSAFAFIVSLGSSCWPMDSDPEQGFFLSPCVFPSVSAGQESGEVITSDLLGEDNYEVDEKAKESILKHLGGREDGRKQVENTKSFPYSTQVYFKVNFPRHQKGSCEIGSGTFVDKDVILTAAHVVYSHDRGGHYNSLQCIAAANGSSAPFGIPVVKGVKISQKYMDKGYDYKEYDYALVFIDRPLGEQTGYMGICIFNDDKLSGIPVTVAGYPGDKISNILTPTMWGMSGSLMTVAPDELHHDVDTFAGQSGSGIWYARERDSKTEYYLVGVHAYGLEEELFYNRGPRLTKGKGKEILDWINAYRNDDKFRFDKRSVTKKTGESHAFGITGEGSSVLPSHLLEKANSENGLDWYEVGLKYANGDDGIPQNDDIAFEWFEKALEWFQKGENQENPEVQHKLGVMYKNGRVVHQNPSKAVQWWQKAADKGHARAQCNLAVMYEEGKGVDRSLGTAFKWYKESADRGYDVAQCYLAVTYEEGTGVKKDIGEAFKWYKKSAGQGNEDALNALERLAGQVTETLEPLKKSEERNLITMPEEDGINASGSQAQEGFLFSSKKKDHFFKEFGSEFKSGKGSADYFYNEIKSLCKSYSGGKGYKFVKFDLLGTSKEMKSITPYDGKGLTVTSNTRTASIPQGDIYLVQSIDDLKEQYKEQWVLPSSYWEHNPLDQDEEREFKRNLETASSMGHEVTHRKATEVNLAGNVSGGAPGIPAQAGVNGGIKQTREKTDHRQTNKEIKRCYEETGKIRIPAHSSVEIYSATYGKDILQKCYNIKTVSGTVPVLVSVNGKESVEFYKVEELFKDIDNKKFFSSYDEIKVHDGFVDLSQEAGHKTLSAYSQSKNVIVYPYFGAELNKERSTGTELSEGAYVSKNQIKPSDSVTLSEKETKS